MAYGYQNYKEQSVETMTKGEMLILLFEEFTKRLIRGKLYLERKEMENFEADIQRAIEIVSYLIESLDMQYPISRELYRMYDYFKFELNRIKIARKPELIDEILPLVKDMKESFKEADKRANLTAQFSVGKPIDTTLGVG
ncbi:MAG: flagellar export chaperone FliS [Eubacteriales bacterium]